MNKTRCFQRLSWLWLLLAFSLLFLLRNILTSLAGDDYSYAFIWDGEHWGNLMDGIGERQRVESIHDILVSQWSHYFTWGGRTPSMAFIQLFVWLGKGWFNIANTLVYVLLMLVLYWMAAGRIESPKRHKGTLLWVLVAMLLGVADYPSTMLWLTGACVYLWTALWQCLFLLPYVLAFRSKQHTPLHIGWGWVFLGLLAGWSEEAGSILTVLLTAVMLFALHRQRRVERWMWTGFAALLVGCLLLILCPGSLHRLHLMQQLAPEYVMPAEMLWSAQMFWANFTDGFLPVVVTESFLLLPILGEASKLCCILGEASKRRFILIFTAAGLLVPVAMMFSPEFPLRAGFHSTVFLTVASAAAVRDCKAWKLHPLCCKARKLHLLQGGVILIAGYCLLVVAGSLYIEQSLYRQNRQRMTLIEQQRTSLDEQQRDGLIVVPALYIPHRLDCFVGMHSVTDWHLIYGGDIEWKPTDNRSLMFARYYGLPAIRTDREVDWKKWNQK